MTPTTTADRDARINRLLGAHNWHYNHLNYQELAKALEAAKTFSRAMWLKEPPHWLTLAGKSGVGKTHLAKSILAFWRAYAGWRPVTHPGTGERVSNLMESRFVAWRALVSRLKEGAFGELQDLKVCPFIVLDDIGAERDQSGFARGILDDLLNARLKRWTVITTNMPLRQIASDIDTRVASRMIRDGSRVIEINAKDYNLAAFD